MNPVNMPVLNPETSIFLLCDMQEKFRNAINYFQEIVISCNKLVQCGKILNIPLIVTEQYPKGLGSTISEINVAHAVGIYPKTKFSMVIPQVEEELQNRRNIESVILFGIEAHVCVEQTALDLLKRGLKVHVVADATSSRSQEDRLLAFKRLQQVGCFISTSESVIFKMIKDKEHPNFNEIRMLVSKPSPSTELSN